MGKLALIATVGSDDKGISLKKGDYIKQALLPFFKNSNAKDVSIHKYLEELKRLKLRPSELAMDLLIISSSMYAADIRINRKEFGEDSWTRMIDLYIPVSDVKVWDSQKKLLESIFKFLTGDIWSINFRERTNKILLFSPKINLRKYKMPYDTDTVCLFSGGMDSFIGSIDLLEQGCTPLLVGHSKSTDVSQFQTSSLEALRDCYKLAPPELVHAFVRIPKGDLFDSEDDNERGRSFMFLSLGAICASSLKAKSKLYVPENGMISLNIPLTPLRSGSHSTRTTHPHYFLLMQELFDNIGLGAKIVNPYQFKTKGEMLKECANRKLVAKTLTMSCSHPFPWKARDVRHCGKCVPCIIRKAAYKAAGVRDNSDFRVDISSKDIVLDIRKKEGADVLAFKYMIEKIRREPTFLNASIRTTGPLGEKVSEYISVYKRSLKEVENLIKNVKLK